MTWTDFVKYKLAIWIEYQRQYMEFEAILHKLPFMAQGQDRPPK